MTARSTRIALALAIVAAIVSACAGVLGLRRETGPRAFPHRAHVTAGVPCTKCHATIPLDDGRSLHIPDDAACASCHTKPHSAVAGADPTKRPCLECHAAVGALDALADAREHLVFDHKPHLADARGNCMRCHVNVADGDDHMRPPMAQCFKCHEHEAQQDARQCSACHRGLEDATTLPQSHLQHDGDWLREHGTRAASAGDLCQTCHRERFCADCHGKTVAVLPATAKFADPFAPSVHRAGFQARHALEARAEPGACATCHRTERCVGCHTTKGITGDGKRSPHPTNWVGPVASDNQHGREARRDPAACASCHDGAGQTLCVKCHSVGGVGGNPHPPGFNSKLPLYAMPCRLCHPVGSSVPTARMR